MKKIVSALLIIPAMGVASAQARTINFVRSNQGEESACQALRVRGTLAVLTDVSGAHHYRISYDKNSMEIFTQDRAVSARMLDYLGRDVYAEGCMDSKGRLNVTKMIALGGQDQGQDKNDQDQGGQDQGQDKNDQDQGGQDQGQDKNDQDQGGQDQGGQDQGQDQGQDKNDQDQGGQDQGGQDQGQHQGQDQGQDKNDQDQGQGDQHQGHQGQDQDQNHHHHHGHDD